MVRGLGVRRTRVSGVENARALLWRTYPHAHLKLGKYKPMTHAAIPSLPIHPPSSHICLPGRSQAPHATFPDMTANPSLKARQDPLERLQTASCRCLPSFGNAVSHG